MKISLSPSDKILCDCCLSKYRIGREMCPYCGYKSPLEYTPLTPHQLKIGSKVGNYIVGMALSADKNSILYISIDRKKYKRVFLREFYMFSCMTRDLCGNVYVTDEKYRDEVQQNIKGLTKCRTKKIRYNNTIYLIEKYRKICLLKKQDSSNMDIGMSSYIGRRNRQEDAAAYETATDFIYAILCDGMGGIDGGEIASVNCLRKMRDVTQSLCLCEENMLSIILKNQIYLANDLLTSLKNEEGMPLHCGTTLICAVIRGNNLYYASVGDSRMYLLRGENIIQLTEEHNLLTELMKLVASDEMEYGDAISHPKREALTSYIGIDDLKLVDISKTPFGLLRGDIILLCSDGLYRALGEYEIMDAVKKTDNMKSAADSLVDIVKQKQLPNQDNTTLILIKKNR